MTEFKLDVCITVDVESDCPPFLDSFRGIEEGMPPLLELFGKEGLKATFFVAGNIAQRYPAAIREIVGQGHELGSHGISHHDFSLMDPVMAVEEIRGSRELLGKFAPVISFRAPYLRFPDKYTHLLAQWGFLIDSSLARYKISYYTRKRSSPIRRIPVSVTSSVLRLPEWLRDPWLRSLSSPVVLFVHPWEFIDLRKEKLPIDCRFRTGREALNCLRSAISFFKRKKVNFLRMKDFLPLPLP